MKKLKIVNIGWAHSIHLARMARWFAKKGHEVHIISDSDTEIKGVNVHDIRRKPDLRPRMKRFKELYFNASWKLPCKINEIIRVRKLIDEISPDIVHAHSLWYPGYLGVYIKGYPFALTVLNGDVLWKKDDINFYTKIRTRWGVRKAGLITGVSEELVNACIRHGARRDKTHVMRRGVDLTRFNCNGDRIEIRHKLGLPEDAKIVLSPRHMDYNLDKIIGAVPEVISRIKNACFVFIWHGHCPSKEEELKKLAIELGVDGFIKFRGFVNHDEVALYHKASDIMVSVPQYDSGPIALQEAMACGDVPVISDLPCVREWIEDGINGVLVGPNDIKQISNSIVELLYYDQMRMNAAKRNWKLIQEKGDQDYWMGKMEKFYYSLLANF